MISNFEDATSALSVFIQDKSARKKRYTLDRMKSLMSYLGNPQNKLKTIHVAGTSGKTSTCYYIASLLKRTDKKVGLTVSPHVDQLNERVQINLIPLPEKEFCQLLDEFLNIISGSSIHPTYFEVLVAFAFWVFDRKQVDYAVVEVGLGGLLDGTNVINRQDKVCVISDIGLDHTQTLGETVEEIAYQKSGIIQRHNTVLFNDQVEEVMSVLQTTAKKQDASTHIARDNTETIMLAKKLPQFQKRNFKLAYATYMFISQRDNIHALSYDQISSALDVVIPARMETVPYKDKTIIFDGAHNQQKLAALVSAVESKFTNKKFHLLVSFGQNKTPHIKESLKELRKLSDTITITTFSLGGNEPRKPIKPHELELLSKECGFKMITVIVDPQLAFRFALQCPQNVILVTGSFYLLNHIRPLVKKLLS